MLFFSIEHLVMAISFLKMTMEHRFTTAVMILWKNAKTTITQNTVPMSRQDINSKQYSCCVLTIFTIKIMGSPD